jgi:hypothetical protein
MHPEQQVAGRVRAMETYRARRLGSAIAALSILLCGQSGAFARGSQVSHDAPWNSEHIDHLPPEIRAAVIHMCGTPPSAGHYFATYLDHAHVVKLHYEHLHCEDRTKFCNGGGCLLQEYESTGGHYHLIRSYYGSD